MYPGEREPSSWDSLRDHINRKTVMTLETNIDFLLNNRYAMDKSVTCFLPFRCNVGDCYNSC